MKRSGKRWVVLAAVLGLIMLSWSVPTRAWADTRQESQAGVPSVIVLPPVIEVNVTIDVDTPFSPQLSLRARIEPPCVGIDVTANCPPPIVVDITTPTTPRP